MKLIFTRYEDRIIATMNMKQRFYKTLRIIFLSFFILSSVTIADLNSNTEIEDSLQRLRKKIDTVLKTSILKGAEIGIQIMSLNSNEIVYERNPDQPLNPASNTKLVTSATALVWLTPQYQFQTSVYTDAKIKGGVLEGNLYLKGGGDPNLTYQELLVLAQDVYYEGVRTVTGDIVGDDTFCSITERNGEG